MQHTLNVHPITGHAGKFIDVDTAQSMIARWQHVNPQGIFSILYGRHVIESLQECAGIRIFNGINTQNKQAFVFAGVTNDGTSLTDYIIWDLGAPCPPRCGPDGPKLAYLWRQPIDPAIDMTEVGSRISLETARDMVTAWQEKHPAGVGSFLFTQAMMTAILNVPGCEGIVVYNGIDSEGTQTLIILPADAAGRCMVNYTIIFPEGTQLADAPIVTGGVTEKLAL